MFLDDVGRKEGAFEEVLKLKDAANGHMSSFPNTPSPTSASTAPSAPTHSDRVHPSISKSDSRYFAMKGAQKTQIMRMKQVDHTINALAYFAGFGSFVFGWRCWEHFRIR